MQRVIFAKRKGEYYMIKSKEKAREELLVHSK
jgi:hypothetical protein